MEKLDYNKLLGDSKDGVLTIIHRNNEAPIKVWYDQPTRLNGTIAAPGNFYGERKEQMKDVIKKSHVKYNYRDVLIILVLSENREINTEVKGSLTVNPDLKMLEVNTKNKLDSKELTELLKFNRYYFADKSQCNAIIEKLQTTKVKIETDLETILNQGTGRERNVYDKVVRGIEPMTYNLFMPLFIGQEPVKFEVTINIDARDSEVNFWLESIELEELKKANAKTIIDAELARFEESGLVMIEQ